MMVSWQERFASKIVSAKDAVKHIRNGQRVFVGSGTGEPQLLVKALTGREDLSDVEVIHIMTFGTAPYAAPPLCKRFRHNAFFIGSNVRNAIAECQADYTPIFLSEIPALFRTGRMVLDTALISISPPDEHGYCSYGVSTDVAKAAAESANMVVAEVNANMPRALGDCFIHVRDIDMLVPSNEPIIEGHIAKPDEESEGIARWVAGLIEDGATLQLGIGDIPDAVLHNLKGFKNLGIHTEMFSDGLLALVECGAVTNAAKTLHRGKIIASFVIGTRKLYDFIDNNPLIEFHPTEYVNDPFIVAKNDKMISINSAVEVDLTGQVSADSIGTRFYSGFGGQLDFTRGAARSKGGKPIIALPSTAQNQAISRIVPYLKQGAGVVTTRGDVHYVVTEYGSAYLHGKNVRERAMALIQIAHPKFRPWLLSEAKARKLVHADQIELPIKTAAYPQELEHWIELKDNSKAFVRPLRLTDESLLRDLFYKLSTESISNRFFQSLKAMPHEKLQELLRIDYEDDMAIVALTASGEDAYIVAIAHYRKNPKTDFAEAAFLVRDDWQRKGIGTALMKTLVTSARKNGIVGFTAEVLMQNHGMLRVFHKCGYSVESKFADGVYSLRIPFTVRPGDHSATPS